MEKWLPVPVAWEAGRVSDVIEGEEKKNTMSEIMLKDICKSYENGFHAVNEFNLEIEKGEFIVFVGPSGCGKSTTLRMIAGLEDITDGELWIGDRLVNYLEPKERDLAMDMICRELKKGLLPLENARIQGERQRCLCSLNCVEIE